MQIYADVCKRPMKLSGSAQTCALGAAIMGSVVGGAHPDVPAAIEAMTRVQALQYVPNPASSPPTTGSMNSIPTCTTLSDAPNGRPTCTA